MAATSMAMPTSLSSCTRCRGPELAHVIERGGRNLGGPTIVEELEVPFGNGIEYWDGEGA